MKTMLMLLLAALPSLSFACDCRGYNIEEAFNEYEIVFRGVVKSTGSKWVWEKGYWFPNTLNKVKMEVIKSYKGKQDKNTIVFTRPTINACGYPFKIGVEYVVFAYIGTKESANNGWEVEGGAMVSSCSPTIHYKKVESIHERERKYVVDFLESNSYKVKQRMESPQK
ncbi:hypothetical protein NCG89_09880 [Spongiibacter taiwanensis]|uniref:hypothetical protein n=1 Tax=Spongiibacter taiwanensis TaxID=1748242 RepID=UPI002035A10C|nr:hypothetical protein [Spongiibacter taiwanensis]USA41826.1 hypothetical protein NCG89_09880 [Spongiibacter taiwanensis]